MRSKKRRIRVSSATRYNPFAVDRKGTLKSQRINIVLPLKSLGFNSPNWVIPIGLLELELAILDSCFKTSWEFENRLFMPICVSFMSYCFLSGLFVYSNNNVSILLIKNGMIVTGYEYI